MSVYRGLGYMNSTIKATVGKSSPTVPGCVLAAAALTLAQAEPDAVDEILTTLPSLKTRERERALIERTLLQPPRQ